MIRTCPRRVRVTPGQSLERGMVAVFLIAMVYNINLGLERAVYMLVHLVAALYMAFSKEDGGRRWHVSVVGEVD